MSYLVDALKKAERERHQQKGADMRSLSAGEQADDRSGNSRMMAWTVAFLIALNIAFLFYLLGPYSDDASGDTNADTGAATIAETSAPASQPAPPDAVTSTPAANEPASAASTTAGSEPAAAAAPRERRQGDLRGLRLSDAPYSGASDTNRSSGGSVTYSSQPLDDSAKPAARPQPSTQAQSQPRFQRQSPNPSRQQPVASSRGGNAPPVTINGHLYSSVPGRSFILVGGRRYHEGERLADGPAVVSIDRKGATLNYQGRRYHVDGPS